MKTKFVATIPVLPTTNIERDVAWYNEKMGMEPVFADMMYAVLHRKNLWLHLQWHADTPDDPLLGGSVIRILVSNITPIYEEFSERGTITADKLKRNTPWKTNEFGFFDLNNNAILSLKRQQTKTFPKQ